MSADFLRGCIFVGFIAAIGCAEFIFPRRKPEKWRLKRWPGNIGVVLVGALLSRLVCPVLPFGLAALMNEKGWGLLAFSGLSEKTAFILTIVIFDVAIYFQHRAFHHYKALWLLHRMHHVDTFYDFTTGIRFHPFEILLSTFWKLCLVAILGPPATAVLLFEVILNSLAMFNHANLKLALKLDRFLRFFVVTPDMHRVHHSVYMDENNRNFGFNFSWWDRLFKTYTPQPRDGHDDMQIGLPIFRESRYQSLKNILLVPFIRP